MSENIMKDREACLNILKEYTKSESLLKHAFAVEASVKAYAKKYGEDELYWGNVALLHDFDYERFPTSEEHPYKGSEILKEKEGRFKFNAGLSAQEMKSDEIADFMKILMDAIRRVDEAE